MKPVAERLGEKLGTDVALAPDVVGEEVEAMAEGLGDGEVLLLENSRYESGETEDDPELAKALAALADLYVNDAFGAAHRAHATTHGVAQQLPGHAGLLLERELEELTKVRDGAERPLVMVLGGAKVTDKIGVIEHFLDPADEILIGGAMCFSFFKAEGRDIGDSLVDDESVEAARELLPRAGEAEATPAPARGPGPGPRVQRRHRDRGPERHRRPARAGWASTSGRTPPPSTRSGSPAAGRSSGTARWAPSSCRPSPPGRGRSPTRWPARDGHTVVGGGDSAAALVQFGLGDDVDWLSTGGGASLEFLEGEELPGVEVLPDA